MIRYMFSNPDTIDDDVVEITTPNDEITKLNDEIAKLNDEIAKLNDEIAKLKNILIRVDFFTTGLIRELSRTHEDYYDFFIASSVMIFTIYMSLTYVHSVGLNVFFCTTTGYLIYITNGSRILWNQNKEYIGYLKDCFSKIVKT